MIDKIEKLEEESKRADILRDYGCNDITQELGQLALKRLANVEENRKKLRKTKEMITINVREKKERRNMQS